MEGYEGTIIYNLVYDTEMPYIEYEEDEFEEYRWNHVIKYEKIRLLHDDWIFPPYQNLLSEYSYLPGLRPNMTKNEVIGLLWHYHRYINKENTTEYDRNRNGNGILVRNTRDQSPSEDRQPFATIGGGMVNKKVKKCEKKKVVLGKERCIYKVSGSKKDYMKYKGKLVPVTDYVKYMKKKN